MLQKHNAINEIIIIRRLSSTRLHLKKQKNKQRAYYKNIKISDLCVKRLVYANPGLAQQVNN
jgi:hypothetical protein